MGFWGAAGPLRKCTSMGDRPPLNPHDEKPQKGLGGRAGIRPRGGVRICCSGISSMLYDTHNECAPTLT